MMHLADKVAVPAQGAPASGQPEERVYTFSELLSIIKAVSQSPEWRTMSKEHVRISYDRDLQIYRTALLTGDRNDEGAATSISGFHSRSRSSSRQGTPDPSVPSVGDRSRPAPTSRPPQPGSMLTPATPGHISDPEQSQAVAQLRAQPGGRDETWPKVAYASRSSSAEHPAAKAKRLGVTELGGAEAITSYCDVLRFWREQQDHGVLGTDTASAFAEAVVYPNGSEAGYKRSPSLSLALCTAPDGSYSGGVVRDLRQALDHRDEPAAKRLRVSPGVEEAYESVSYQTAIMEAATLENVFDKTTHLETAIRIISRVAYVRQHQAYIRAQDVVRAALGMPPVSEDEPGGDDIVCTGKRRALPRAMFRKSGKTLSASEKVATRAKQDIAKVTYELERYRPGGNRRSQEQIRIDLKEKFRKTAAWHLVWRRFGFGIFALLPAGVTNTWLERALTRQRRRDWLNLIAEKNRLAVRLAGALNNSVVALSSRPSYCDEAAAGLEHLLLLDRDGIERALASDSPFEMLIGPGPDRLETSAGP